MSLSSLIESNLLIPIDVPLPPHEQRMRLLYGTPVFIRWLDDRLNSDEPSSLSVDVTPKEQIDALFYLFLSGRPLVYSRQFRYIKAEEQAVWELKTPDFRLFGWFPFKDCFVCAFGDWADKIKDHDLYQGYRIATRRVRKEMGFGPDSCVQGFSSVDVLS